MESQSTEPIKQDGRAKPRDRTMQGQTIRIRHKAIKMLISKYQIEFDEMMKSLGYIKGHPAIPSKVLVQPVGGSAPPTSILTDPAQNSEKSVENIKQ